MKICFDLRALQIGHETRGIGMYVKSILEHIEPGDHEFIFYTFGSHDPIKKLGIKFAGKYELIKTPRVSTVVSTPKDIFNFLRLSFHRFSPLKKHRPGVFVQFDFNLGIPHFRKTKNVVIAYDLIPLLMKNEYLPSVSFAWHHSAGKRAKLKAVVRAAYYRMKYALSYRVFKKADQLVAISEATKQSFVESFDIPTQKIDTIPLAPVLSLDSVDMNVANKIKKPYLFYVGGADSRKRLVDVVRAFHIARSQGLNVALVLGGHDIYKVKKISDPYARHAILDSPYKKDIHLVGFISDAEKLGLYQNAYAFVFCSVFEGFGLPVVEAMAASCPVVCYNNSSIPEAAGDAALFAETGNYVEVAQQLLAIQDKKLRESLISKGKKQAAKFSWEKYAHQFIKTIT